MIKSEMHITISDITAELKVWSFLHGWGVLTGWYTNMINPVGVVFDAPPNWKMNFFTDGRKEQHGVQMLFWGEISYDIPPKPQVAIMMRECPSCKGKGKV